MVAPQELELIRRLFWAVLPESPGGPRITAQEFQRIVGALTGVVAGALATGAAVMLIGAIAGRFAKEAKPGGRGPRGLVEGR